MHKVLKHDLTQLSVDERQQYDALLLGVTEKLTQLE